MIGLNKIGLNQVQLNRLRLNAPFPTCRKMAGGGGSSDGFPQLPGDVTRWHFGGLTNEMMAAMDDPRIEDADHKGRFLSFKNFAWGGMSGVGGYVQNFNYFKNNATVDKVRIDEQSSNSVKVTILATVINNAIYIPKDIYQFNKSYFIKISSEGYNEGDLSLSFYAPSTSTATTVKVPLNPNGITEIPAIKEDDFLAVYLNVGGKVGSITIEQLPLYPGALVFDGVDDWAGCDNLPLLPKEKGYSIIALRNWITRYDATQYKRPLISNLDTNDEGAFLIEYRKDENVNGVTGSYNSFTDVYIDDNNPITWQTSSSYNGQIIKKGTSKSSNKLCICKTYFSQLSKYANAAIWEIVILDHDATEEELTKIKDYFVKTYPWLFPDQAWTVTGKTNEDEDRATIANITGNGNDLVLSNFGFAEGSGYGLYDQNYISYAITNRAVYTKTNSSIHVTKSITAGVNFTESARDVTIPSYRIKVTGIQSGQEMIYRGSNNTFLTNIPSDGIYVLPAVENGSNLGFQFVSYTGDCDITIEQIPEYEGYLVTDGVDDKVVSAESIAFTDTWTIITDTVFLGKVSVASGILASNIFTVYNYQGSGTIAVAMGEGGSSLRVITSSIKAFSSDGTIYDAEWNEYHVEIGTIRALERLLKIGTSSNETSYFCQLAFKFLGIYNNQILSKDDCIKAYNYLQTLKAK